jgi:hypothetical protein
MTLEYFRVFQVRVSSRVPEYFEYFKYEYRVRVSYSILELDTRKISSSDVCLHHTNPNLKGLDWF